MTIAWLVLGACEAPPPAASAAGEAPAVAAPEPLAAAIDRSRVRAEQALRAQRIHTPAGDNAVESYLALREREPQAADVAAALAELQPYVLIAAEQALAAGEIAEAWRLLALLERIDAQAPALPRLRGALAQRGQAAREAAPAAPLASAPTPAPAALAAAKVTPAAASAPARTPPAGAATATAPARTDAAPASVATAAPPPAAPPAATTPPSSVPPRAHAATRAPPRLLSDAAPRYPLAARNRRIEGSAVVAFTVRPDSSVGNARVLSARPAGVFEESALAAAVRWRFEATGRSVDGVRTLTFRLPKDG
ncbi:energy transducer TonB [Vulcaniibacterium tengchongense]|uniref:energy transducer TonB n=1 Tax=Vulcaniibacterium tengchongense TaxID=1273429 RepID=UPI000F5020BB|nr:energy transducer TonB [Vulcaniibacterium tengchongense]